MAVQWSYQWARKFSVSRFEVLYHVVRSDFFANEFGVRMDHFLIVPKGGGNEALYAPDDEYNQFAQRVYQKLISSEKIYQHYKALIKRDQKEFLATTKQIVEKPLASMTLQELSQAYTTFFDINNQFFNTAIWIPFSVEPFISEAAIHEFETLVQQHGAEQEYQTHFDAIFLPERKNAVTCEREALLEIVESGREIDAQLKKHAAEYGWIPCYDINDTPWNVDHFRQLLKEAKQSDWQRELTALRKWNARPVQFKKTIELLQPSSEQRLLLTSAHDMVFIKDERDDYRRQGSYAIQPLFKEIGRQMGDWTIHEVTALLSTEVQQFFNTGELPQRSKIQERLQGYVIIFQPGDTGLTIHSGEEAKRIMAQQFPNVTAIQQNELRGVCGARGSAEGAAVIVHTKKDLNSVKQGDILIAVTTHPDFVPAMRRAVAIVTDEGGITSHAAIVSRELGIPCIVGTKNATAVFANGDRVQVNADKGVVKKIE